MNDKNKVIWVTGAGSGIGRSAALEFARSGFSVAASSRRLSPLETLEREVEHEGLMFHLVPCDISSPSRVEDAVNEITSIAGDIDCLINNAGITSFKPAEENSLKEIRDIIETNLLGSIYAIKAVLPGMIKRKRGTVINVLSTAAIEVLKGSSAYAASKAGLLAYTDVLREEVRKYNIRIIDIIPGPTRTPMWPEEMMREHGSKMMDPHEVARMMLDVYINSKTMVTERVILKPIGGSI
ncbi:MAG TPA: SDR family NAD(P)-dependent oxidoreductase [Ignavibacteriales bacterium]|nr:SDR family NAD(P)-dependent oxidoreductase [Ignavibacteriales bacterium]